MILFSFSYLNFYSCFIILYMQISLTSRNLLRNRRYGMPYLMINGIKHDFEAFGNISNPPLILLYGGAATAEGWHAWDYNNSISRLAEENYVICYNRRGHGQTRCPAGTTLEDIAKDLFAFMDALCIEKANLAGLSAGTYLLGCAAGIAPERFNSMILIVPHSHTEGGSPYTQAMRKLGLDSANMTPEQEAQTARLSWAPSTPDKKVAIFDEWYKQFEHFPTLPQKDVIAAYKTIFSFDHRENFKKFDRPALIISGEKDVFCPPEVGREIAASIPGSQFVEVPNTAHMVFYEENELCVETIKDFLRSVR